MQIVSVNNCVSFLLLCYKYGSFVGDFEPALMWGAFMILLYLYYSFFTINQMDDYSIYYGDFFFNVDEKFSTELLFGILPCPHYLFGYIGYYGLAVMSNNFYILSFYFCCHILDLIFIRFVEVPHNAKNLKPTSITFEVMIGNINLDYMKALYTFFSSDLVCFINFDPFRSGDFLTLFIVLYTIATSVIVSLTEKSKFKDWLFIG